MNINLSKKEENPILTANFISKWSFWWVLKLLYKGQQRPLKEEEIYAQPLKLDSERLTKKFTHLWHEELQRKNQSILRLIIRAYGLAAFRFAFLYSAVETATKILQTICLGALLTSFADKSENSNNIFNIYLYAFGVVIFSVFAPLLYHPYTLYMFSISGRIRLGLSGLIYKKILVTSNNASNDEINGRAVNLLSNDLAKFDRALNLFQDLFKGPCQMFILGYLMYREIGWSALLGIAFIILLIPLQGWCASRVAIYRKRAAQTSDKRVKLMNELIQGIQVIKMYAWEKSFANRITEIRQTELRAIGGTMNILAMLAVTSIIPKISIFLSLVAYVYFGDVITARKVFIVSSLFNTLSFTMVTLWPMAATYWAEAYISCKRVREFLLHNSTEINKELNIFHYYNNNALILSDDPNDKNEPDFENCIKLKNVDASWNNQVNAVKNINLDIVDKSTVAIVGAVGAGKSSLLNIILGELQINQGVTEIKGNLSYASQLPWIFEGTIKDNIIFISEYDEQRYQKVIEVCALRKDLEVMHNGDLTIVGERGTSLSGGQKARINLARAIYKEADIYLLDDPLSAVDAHVGSHIFKNCITDYLKNKICVLVTHQLQYLNNIEQVILIKNGQIEAKGSFNYLTELKLFQYMDERKKSNKKSSIDRADSIRENSIFPLKAESEKNVLDENREEIQTIGSVQFRVYKLYFQSVKSWFCITLVALLFFFGRALTGGIDYFISKWVNWEEKINQNKTINSNNSTHSENNHIAERVNIILVYTGLLLFALILFILQNFGFFKICLRISKNLHRKLYNGVSRASMLFFNMNSSGRILNRFSKDINTIDSVIPQILLDCITFICNLTAVLVIVSIANYILLLPAIVVGVLFYLLRRFYITPSRSIKRIEALSRSPIYSHINQTFQGLPTIRALNAQTQMESNFHFYQNSNTSPWYMFIATSYAFGFWLDFVIFIYTASVILVLIVFKSHVSSGEVGLAILQCLSLVGGCQWGIKQSAELENQMVSAERIQEYAEEPSEASPAVLLETVLDESWPSEGKILFKNFSMKYSKSGKTVLRNFSVEINSKQKIGIVGRTGAGKSSIIQALFGLAYNEGIIEIDGIDINKIELHRLRQKISIIPQDPVLFSGTIRTNLDPFEESSDEDLWKVIEEINLKPFISVNNGLDCVVNDGGCNFSVGQRQLICLARAILRDNRILILDEATANVDLETDQFLQHLIKVRFKNCTILTIAHRLNTVMDSDKILVMDDGNLVEIGRPKDLLKIRDGYFYNLFQRCNRD